MISKIWGLLGWSEDLMTSLRHDYFWSSVYFPVKHDPCVEEDPKMKSRSSVVFIRGLLYCFTSQEVAVS